ncbi:substrate-binding periplasmic protein [Fluviispira vulneris]|uniref:substrate-binding periplasmic protein n=1 Tax=Fluviispira vulneris TaxID=2763012 RepID=UPI0016466FB7|nr:transporter substrate-binding domain-containing protein [Fluviispira vulneris]
MFTIFLKNMILIYILCITCSAFSAPEREVLACWDVANRPPFTYSDPAEPNLSKGFVIDLIEEIAKRKNFKLVIEGLPWNRCLDLTKKGVYQIVLGATENSERRIDYLYSERIFSTNTVLYYNKSKYPHKPIIRNNKDLDAYTYCGRFARNYSDLSFKNNILIYARDEQQLFKLLRAKRCDFILGEKEFFAIQKKTGILDFSGLEELEIVGQKPKKYFF